jgi:hypothetical protein
MKQGGIGALHDNKPKTDKDRELAKKVLKFNLKVMQLGHDKPKSPEELENRFVDYLTMCADEGMPPTVEGLALCSGWARQSFYEIEQGKYNLQFTDIVKKAKDYVCNYDSSMANLNKLNAPIYIFRAKNFYDMKDVQEIKAGPVTDPTKPNNENDILNAMPELPEGSTASPIQIEKIGDFDND